MLAEKLLLNPIILDDQPHLEVTCADHPVWAVTFPTLPTAVVRLLDVLGAFREHLIDQHGGKGVLPEVAAEVDSRIQDH